MAGNINFVPMSSYDLEGQEIVRRRKMAEMLQAQSMAPIEQQSVGGMVAPISITHGLAKLLQGYSARKGQEAADEAQRALGERYQGARTADMQLLAKALEGRPATPETMSEDAAGNAMPIPAQAAVPGGRIDPSVLGRLQTPEISNAAMQMWAAQLKKPTPAEMFGKVNPSEYTPESIAKFTQTGDFSALVPVRKHEFVEVAGPDGAPVRQAVNPFAPPTAPLPVATKVEVAPSGLAFNPFTTKPGAQFNDPNKPLGIGNDGKAFVNQPYVEAQKEIGKARATNVNLAVSTDRGYLGDVAQGLAKSDVGIIDAGRSAPDRLAGALRVKEILTKNPITGTGAEARLSINKALSTAGVIDGDRVKSTEDLAGQLASATLDAIKTSGLGGGQGFTDKDRQFLERARSGNIEINAGTLRELADLNERSARESIKKANATIKRLKTMPGSGNMGAGLEEIQEPGGASPGALSPTAQEYLRKAREGR